jgi:hypothetical protein
MGSQEQAPVFLRLAEYHSTCSRREQPFLINKNRVLRDSYPMRVVCYRGLYRQHMR